MFDGMLALVNSDCFATLCRADQRCAVLAVDARLHARTYKEKPTNKHLETKIGKKKTSKQIIGTGNRKTYIYIEQNLKHTRQRVKLRTILAKRTLAF